MARLCRNFTQMFSMKNILIKFKLQLSRAKVNVKVAIVRNMLLAVQCFHLWIDFDILGTATSWISLCFSIIGLRSRSQLLLEEFFFIVLAFSSLD